MNRSMCLYVPYLPIERLKIGGGGAAPDAQPIAVTERRANALRVVRCNRAACDGGVGCGMTVAEATALLPSLRLEPGDARADLGALKALAAWAQAFSPIVQIEEPDALLLDVTGCARLFRGEWNLLRRATSGLGDRGFSPRAAIAGTPGAAWAIAHGHDASAVVTQPGRDVEDLLRLPVGVLRIDARTVSALQSVGVETIEGLMVLPRSSLSARFGDRLLYRLDQALGDVPEPLRPFEPPQVLRAHLRLGAATDRRDVIHRAAERVLSQVCAQLTRRVLGATRLHVTFCYPATPATTITVTVSEPTRSFQRWRRILTARLERVRLPDKTDGVVMWTREVERLDGWQEELFETRASDGHEVSELVDRLSVRLGRASVTRVAMVSDHQPERAYRYVPHSDTCEATKGQRIGTKARRHGGTEGGREGTSVRPLCVWDCPVQVSVVSPRLDGPPAAFRFRSAEHRVATCVGPERLETGWWRGPEIRRDYFRVVSESGESFWIFRDRENGKWFVHGVFD